MERADGIGGGHLPTDDPGTLGRWYADHLGLAADPHHDAHGRPGIRLSTTPITGEASSAAWSVRVTVSDLDTRVSQLRAAGLEVAVRDTPQGRAADLRDPEGNVVQLWQPAPELSSADEPADEPEPPPRTAGLKRWLPLALIGVLIVGVVAILQEGDDKDGDNEEAAPPRPTLSITLDVSDTADPDNGIISSTVDTKALGFTGDWEIFAAGADELARIEAAEGHITRTFLPDDTATGPVALAVGPDSALVMSIESGDSYVVRDGKRPYRFPEANSPMNNGGAAYPGPRPDQLWITRGRDNMDSRQRLRLFRFDGTPVGEVIEPGHRFWISQPDGSGYVIAEGNGGAYLARPDGLRRLTSGNVLAASASRLLVEECDTQARCRTAVIDRRTGARRPLDTRFDLNAMPGAISPDGSYAALATLPDLSGSSAELILIDLASGQVRVTGVLVQTFPSAQTFAWSPDGRWLFVATSDLRLVAVDTRAPGAHDLGLSDIQQVAVRPG